MRTNSIATSMAFASLCLSGAAQAQAPEFDTAAIDRSVTTYMSANEVPGVVIGVVVGNAVVYAKAFGVADVSNGSPMQKNSMFQIASVTKLFTASLMVALEQDGVLTASDPVDNYLDGATAPRDAYGRAIRLMDLATHVSGLPKDPLNRRDRPNSPTVSEPYAQADLYEALANTRLLWAPGGGLAYSSFGYGLLGHALERAADVPLEEVMRRRLWAPLGMEHTYVFGRPRGEPELAAHHWDWYSPRRPSPAWEFGAIWGMNGVHSNMPDLAHFLSLQFRAYAPGGAVIDGRRLAEMHEPRVMRSQNFDRENGAFGIGWIVKFVEGAGVLIEHDGNNDGHGAYLAALPQEGVGLIVLANLGGVADEIGEAVLPYVLEPVIARKRNLQNAFERGEWEAVRNSAEELLVLNRHNRRARYFLGRALAETGQCDEAGPHLATAYAAGMYREYVAFYQAVCAAQAEYFDMADEALERAVELGFLEGERLERHPALDALAGHPAYELLKRYAHH